MKDILGRLNELLSVCEARVKQCDDDAGRNLARANQLEVEGEALKKLDKELKAKAKRLKDLQDIADVRAEIIAAEDKVKSELAKIAEARSSYEEYRSAEDKKIKESTADIIRRREKLEDAERKLAEDKKVFRAKIIEDVHRENALRRV